RRVIKSRDGNAPRALPRDAPIRSALHGGLDAALAPIGDPVDPVDFVESALAEGPRLRGTLFRRGWISSGIFSRHLVVNLDEPVVHRAKNNGCLAAPAVRIAVVIVLLVQKGLTQAQLVQNGFIGVAFTMLLEDRFPYHLFGHLLLERQIVGVSEPSV